MNGPTDGHNEQQEYANQQAARRWIAAHPSRGISDLARHLAHINNRPNHWPNFKSEASRWWHTYNPQGNNYQPER